jgi:hypothetical protein
MDLTISLIEPSIYTSMDYLVRSQIIGILIGSSITFGISYYFRSREEKRLLCELRMKSYLDLLGLKMFKEGDPIPDVWNSAIRITGIYGSDNIKNRVRDYYAFKRQELESKEDGDNRLFSMVFEIQLQAQNEVITLIMKPRREGH